MFENIPYDHQSIFTLHWASIILEFLDLFLVNPIFLVIAERSSCQSIV